jgi:hypothetical protein
MEVFVELEDCLELEQDVSPAASIKLASKKSLVMAVKKIFG